MNVKNEKHEKQDFLHNLDKFKCKLTKKMNIYKKLSILTQIILLCTLLIPILIFINVPTIAISIISTMGSLSIAIEKIFKVTEIYATYQKVIHTIDESKTECEFDYNSTNQKKFEILKTTMDNARKTFYSELLNIQTQKGGEKFYENVYKE